VVGYAVGVQARVTLDLVPFFIVFKWVGEHRELIKKKE
jgi:hypothetical protein